MSSVEYKSIKVSKDTYKNLVKLGNLEDTFDIVISRLVNESRNAAAVAASAKEESD